MPNAGSQVILCDLPIRFDTYKGCSHACAYCFVTRNGKYDISNIKKGEGVESLKNFISGKRTKETNWCDWDIPLHWGGVSDPFQPIELKHRLSFECLKVFAATGYPFVVSTKNALIASNEYLEVIKKCNCVIQISMACEDYDNIEPGASTFAERLKAIKQLSKYVRVIVRVQPYLQSKFNLIYKNIALFAENGAYGVIFESIKYFKKIQGTVKIGADFTYPIESLKQQFNAFKLECHRHGLKFYSGENRLRRMGDSLCCCGIDGMGWKANKANLNHYLYDKSNYQFTKQMEKIGTADFAGTISQETKTHLFIKNKSYKDVMELFAQSKNCLTQLIDYQTSQ